MFDGRFKLLLQHTLQTQLVSDPTPTASAPLQNRVFCVHMPTGHKGKGGPPVPCPGASNDRTAPLTLQKRSAGPNNNSAHRALRRTALRQLPRSAA